MHVALRRPDRHPRDPRDLLVREAERVAQHEGEPLVRGEPRERLEEIAPSVGERGQPGWIPVVAGRLVGERERLGLAQPLVGDPVTARVHDEPMQPRRELGLSAKLTQPRAELDERLLCRVPSLFEVTDYLRRDPLDTRRVPLDERVERVAVAVRRLGHEIHVAQLPVCLPGLRRSVFLRLTSGGGGGLHGRVSLATRDMPDSLAPDAVEPLLTGRLGRPYLYESVCDSTQHLLDSDLEEGAVAVCDQQTAGRGRLGRSWEAPAGTAILCSTLFRPPAERTPAELSLVAGLAVAETVERATGLAAQIKWPNDVMVNRRKVAGVLAEALAECVIVGIGLNVNQARTELPAGSTTAPASLLTVDGVRRERGPLLADLLVALERAYDRWREEGLDGLYEGLGSRDFLRGRRIFVDGRGGFGIGIDRRGRLEVQFDGERRLVESGEVLFER